jgi:hypothetical protein
MFARAPGRNVIFISPICRFSIMKVLAGNLLFSTYRTGFVREERRHARTLQQPTWWRLLDVYALIAQGALSWNVR